MKDICPRCGELKTMTPMNYSRYRAICEDCETENKYSERSIVMTMVIAALFGVVLVLYLQLHALSERIDRIQSLIYDIDSRTDLLK